MRLFQLWARWRLKKRALELLQVPLNREFKLPSLDNNHANEICAMLVFRLFAIFSTLNEGHSPIQRLDIVQQNDLASYARVDNGLQAFVIVHADESIICYALASARGSVDCRCAYRSVLLRWVSFSASYGRARTPRASGDHGIDPTPSSWRECYLSQWIILIIGSYLLTFSVGNISLSSSRYTRL